MSGPGRSTADSRRLLATVSVIVAIVLAMSVGLWLWIGERLALDSKYYLASTAPNRIDVTASIQRVDAAGRELTLRVLVALAAFRNTAPGSPPIGSILDYAAFLWAEAIIAVCVIVTVLSGNRVEGSPRPAEGSSQ